MSNIPYHVDPLIVSKTEWIDGYLIKVIIDVLQVLT